MIIMNILGAIAALVLILLAIVFVSAPIVFAGAVITIIAHIFTSIILGIKNLLTKKA